MKKQSQNKPNFQKAKMNVNIYYTEVYDNILCIRSQWKQTQSKPIFKRDDVRQNWRWPNERIKVNPENQCHVVRPYSRQRGKRTAGCARTWCFCRAARRQISKSQQSEVVDPPSSGGITPSYGGNHELWTMYHEILNTLNATETSCATVQRNTIYERLRTNLSTFYAKQTQFPKSQNGRKLILAKLLWK